MAKIFGQNLARIITQTSRIEEYEGGFCKMKKKNFILNMLAWIPYFRPEFAKNIWIVGQN